MFSKTMDRFVIVVFILWMLVLFGCAPKTPVIRYIPPQDEAMAANE